MATLRMDPALPELEAAAPGGSGREAPPQLSGSEKKELRRFKYEKERTKEQDIKLEYRRLTAALGEKKKVCCSMNTCCDAGPGPSAGLTVSALPVGRGGRRCHARAGPARATRFYIHTMSV